MLYMTGGPHWLGGAQYTRNLLLALDSLPPQNCPPIVIKIVPSRDCTNLEQLARQSTNITVDREYLKLSSDGIRSKARLSDDCNILFPEKGVEMPSAHQTPIHWIPDFQYKYMPEYFSEEERKQRDLRYEQLLDNAKFLVLSSQDAIKDFKKFYPTRQSIPVEVLSFRAVLEEKDLAEPSDDLLARFSLPENFAYCPNQMWQHKGHNILFDALALLKRRGILIPLVCTGALEDYRAQDFASTMLDKISALGLTDQIRFLGVLSREEQIQVYRKASLVVQPSRFEGWSTVVEEARALDKRIVISDIAVHKEQNPPRSTFFADGVSESLAEVLGAEYQDCLDTDDRPDLELLRKNNKTRAAEFANSFLKICTRAYMTCR